jgi:hypothetical protein
MCCYSIHNMPSSCTLVIYIYELIALLLWKDVHLCSNVSRRLTRLKYIWVVIEQHFTLLHMCKLMNSILQLWWILAIEYQTSLYWTFCLHLNHTNIYVRYITQARRPAARAAMRAYRSIAGAGTASSYRRSRGEVASGRPDGSCMPWQRNTV